jgi:hypothetical protein
MTARTARTRKEPLSRRSAVLDVFAFVLDVLVFVLDVLAVL